MAQALDDLAATLKEGLMDDDSLAEIARRCSMEGSGRYARVTCMPRGFGGPDRTRAS